MAAATLSGNPHFTAIRAGWPLMGAALLWTMVAVALGFLIGLAVGQASALRRPSSPGG